MIAYSTRVEVLPNSLKKYEVNHETSMTIWSCTFQFQQLIYLHFNSVTISNSNCKRLFTIIITISLLTFLSTKKHSYFLDTHSFNRIHIQGSTLVIPLQTDDPAPMCRRVSEMNVQSVYLIILSIGEFEHDLARLKA